MFVEPDALIDESKNYADGEWHNVVARRLGTNAYITIDGVFRGILEVTIPKVYFY